MTSLNLAPRVVFITPAGSLFSRFPCVASRISIRLLILIGNDRLLASQQFKQPSRPPTRCTLYENRVLVGNNFGISDSKRSVSISSQSEISVYIPVAVYIGRYVRKSYRTKTSSAYCPYRRFTRDITSSPSSSECVDIERLIVDANMLSCSRDRNGVTEWDAGPSDLKSAHASRVSGVVVGVAIVCSACAFLIGLFEENR